MTPSLETITALFSRVLDVDCTAEDNFFDLGGDSLKAEELMTALSALASADFEISLLLDYPSPRDLAERLQAGQRT